MSGMFAVSQNGSTHGARDDMTNRDEFEFLMLSQIKHSHLTRSKICGLPVAVANAVPALKTKAPPPQGVTAGPRRSIKTKTVAQRTIAKIQSISIRRRLRLLLIHRRAATSSPRSKGRYKIEARNSVLAEARSRRSRKCAAVPQKMVPSASAPKKYQA